MPAAARKVPQLDLCESRVSWIDHSSRNACSGHELVQKLELLGPHLHAQGGYAGNIAARADEASEKPKLERNDPNPENDGDPICCRQRSQDRMGVSEDSNAVTLRRTRSAARLRQALVPPSAQRYSTATFFLRR